MKRKVTLLYMALIVSMILGTCSSTEKLNSGKIEGMADIHVPSDFSWSVITEYRLIINADESGMVYIQSNKGVTYHKAHLTGSESYSVLLTIPATEKEIRILLNKNEAFLNLSSQTIYYSFESASKTDDQGRK